MLLGNQMLTLEIIAAIISGAGVWLMARRSLLCWPVSILGVVMYGGIFLVSKLYSDMLLQGFFAATNVYGWVLWKQSAGSDEETICVAIPSVRELGLGFAGATVFAVGLGYVMATFTDAASPWLDSALTSFSLVATLGSSRRFIESWWLWIALDVIYIGLYTYKHLYPTAVLYAVYIVICCYGAAEWRRAARDQTAGSSRPINKPDIIDLKPG
jgi:nicotinamide mononucleotide transporter